MVPRDVVRHMRSTVSPASHLVGQGWGRGWPGACAGRVCRVAPRGACWDLDAFSPAGQPVWHGDRREHRLRREAHWHQLHRLPRQQQGPAAHLGEPAPPATPADLPSRGSGSLRGTFPGRAAKPSSQLAPCSLTMLLVSQPLRREVRTQLYVSSRDCWFPFSSNAFFWNKFLFSLLF